MIYLFVNFLLLIFSPLKRKPAITYTVFIVLLLFWGFGYTNGTDWIGYYSNYVSINVNNCSNCGENFEVGYNFIVKTIGKLGFFCLVFVCATFNAYSIIRFSKISKFPYFIIFCIFSMYGWFLYIEQIRQALALSIILFGIPSLYSKRIIQYVFYVLIACLFHSTAAFALIFLLPVIAHKKTVPLFVFAMLVLPLIIVAFSVNIFALILPLIPPGSIVFNKLLFYYMSDNYSPKLTIGIGVIGDILFLFIFLALGMRRQRTYQNDLSFFGVYIFVFILFAGKFQNVFLRMAYYAFPFVVIYCSIVMEKFKLSSFSKAWAFYTVRFLVFVYFTSLVIRPFITHPVIAHDVINYRSAFFHIQELDDFHYTLARDEKCQFLDSLGYGYLCGY